MLLLLLLIQCKISLYFGSVRPVRCFVTPIIWRHTRSTKTRHDNVVTGRRTEPQCTLNKL